MALKVIIFGATGMVGQGALLEACKTPDLSEILCITRNKIQKTNPKIKNIVLKNLFDLNSIQDQLKGYDACFFCLGTSSLGKSEKQYKHISYDLTLKNAEILKAKNPNMTFIYVSAAGADSSEKGKVMWARVRGKIENKLFSLGFKSVHSMRPSYIQPFDGIKSRTTLYRILYNLVGFAFPLFQRITPNSVTSTRSIGKAMIYLARTHQGPKILGPKEINELAHKIEST